MNVPCYVTYNGDQPSRGFFGYTFPAGERVLVTNEHALKRAEALNATTDEWSFAQAKASEAADTGEDAASSATPRAPRVRGGGRARAGS